MNALYTDEKFAEIVEQQTRDYGKLSNALLVKKIRHLVRAEGRCYHWQNAALIRAFRAAALEIVSSRATPPGGVTSK